jgi:hypothetical protein
MTDKFIEFMDSAKTNPLKKDIQLLEIKNAKLQTNLNILLYGGMGLLLIVIIYNAKYSNDAITRRLSITELKNKEV